MKKLLLSFLLIIGGLTSSFAQDCSDDRDATNTDRVDYVRFTRGNETFVLLRSEEAHYADLSGVTVTHEWSYVKNGNNLEVRLPVNSSPISNLLLLTLPNFVGIGAFTVDLNTLTKVNFTTYVTQSANVNGSIYTFNQ